MKVQTLITAALLCGAPIAIASSGTFASTTPEAVVSPDGDYEALATEFAATQLEFAAKLKTASKSERREMRANSPIKTFWPRFVALSDSGEGQATFWLVDNIKANRDIRSKERGETLLPLYRTIADKHANAEWIIDAAKSIASNKKYLGDDAVGLLDTIAESANDDNAQAAALYYAISIIGKSDPEKVAAYTARIEDEFAGTMYGTAVRALSAKDEDSQVGKIAPAFGASTIDGHSFALEDYRGKVVVLDFYGFW